MTKKDYIAIAREMADIVTYEQPDPETLRKVCKALADVFARDNGRFDRERFYAACKVS